MEKEYRIQLADMVILLFAYNNEIYSYELVSKIFSILSVNEGISYPKIRELLNDGYLESYEKTDETNEIKRFYRATESGRKKCERLIKEYTMINEKISPLMKGAANNDEGNIHC